MIKLYVIPFKINSAPTLIITCLSMVCQGHRQSKSKQRKKDSAKQLTKTNNRLN